MAGRPLSDLHHGRQCRKLKVNDPRAFHIDPVSNKRRGVYDRYLDLGGMWAVSLQFQCSLTVTEGSFAVVDVSGVMIDMVSRRRVNHG